MLRELAPQHEEARRAAKGEDRQRAEGERKCRYAHGDASDEGRALGVCGVGARGGGVGHGSARGLRANGNGLRSGGEGASAGLSLSLSLALSLSPGSCRRTCASACSAPSHCERRPAPGRMPRSASMGAARTEPTRMDEMKTHR